MSTQDYIALGLIALNMVFTIYHLARTKKLTIKSVEKALLSNRTQLAAVLADVASKFATAKPAESQPTTAPAGTSTNQG